MSWTSADDLKAQLNRLWERGELLRPLMHPAPPEKDDHQFPLRLALSGPSSAELTGQFEAVRSWTTALVGIQHVRIEWREVNHRVQGLQRLPQSVWIDTLDDALTLIGKRGDAARFTTLITLTRSEQPQLLEWLAKRPLQAVALAAQWPLLLAVVGWVAATPRPGVYLRQVDIPGVHSKFIETHRSILMELLDLTLPSATIAAERTGVSQFAARYGFLDKPTRIRFRVLDERIGLLPGPALPDVTLDADSFAKLDIQLQRVFITENETNFLAFPRVAKTIVIFGAGYGWDALAQAGWLAQRTIHYWGDIDTHGFAILDQLRSRFAHVASLLMVRATLMAHEPLWGNEADQIVHDLPRLTRLERALFDELRDNRIRKGLRLEQERVGFQCLATALKVLDEGSDSAAAPHPC